MGQGIGLGSKRAVGRSVAFLALLFAMLAVSVGTASAADVYARTATIGSPGTGNGELSLREHSGVAVNGSSGDVYVADTGNGRVEQFEADGTFVRVFGSFSSPTFIAIDNSGTTPTGDVYVADTETGTVSKFAADGSAITTWGTGGQLAGFPELNGIAVGPDGDLYVLNEKTVSRFDPAGNPVGAPFLSPRESGSRGLAVDTEGNLYKTTGGEEVVKFDNTGARLAEPDPRNDASALSTDRDSGDLFVAQDNGNVPIIQRYALNCGEDCDPLETFGVNELSRVSGIAIAPGGIRYVAGAGTSAIAVFTLQTVEPPAVSGVTVGAFTGTSAHFSGEVNPNGFAAVCEFQVVTDTQFDQGGFAGAKGVPCASNPGSGSSPVAVEADAGGLLPGTEYHVRLRASNAGGAVSSPEPNPTFTTAAVAPVINSETVTRVDLTEAILGARITPGGAATTYRFEYLDEATYLAEGFASPATHSTPELGPLPPDNSPHTISAAISGLDADTAYLFRVVATNSVETVPGAPLSFRTPAPSSPPSNSCPNQIFRIGLGASLPDCRAYEQVTPVDKGGLYVEGFTDLIGAAADGSGVTYISGAGSGFPAGGGGRQDTTTYLSSRSSDGGSWSVQRLLPPEALGGKAEFLGTSRNMRFALVEAGTESEPGLFLIDTATESVVQIAPYQSEHPSRGAFGYDAISADGSRVFFEAEAKLTPDAIAGGIDNLYMWERASGELSLVGQLPADEGGSAPPGGSFGGAYAWYSEDTERGGSLAGLYVEAVNAASPEGDQIYFTAGLSGQLYLRRGLTGPSPVTVRISKPEAGVVDPFAPHPAAFQEATPDGSHAFFVSSDKLTEDASTGEFDEGADLYRYDKEDERLVDITGGQESEENPNGARVLGLLGASSDGSSGYFAARRALAPGATGGLNNIYRFDEDEETGEITLTFIDQVGEDTTVCGAGSGARNWSPSTYCAPAIDQNKGKTSRVTPDGQTLVFTKPFEEVEGIRRAEIFAYRAATEETTCISCSPSSAVSAGLAELTASFFNANEFVIPGALPAARLTRNVSADGTRVFFQTPNSLVAADNNGPPNCTYLQDLPALGKRRPSCVDVYEWEAPGAPGGSCAKAEVNGGCLYLLSSGRSEEGSYFLDATADGSSAFIATTSPLVPSDADQLYDVYGVRTNGGIASQFAVAGPSCEGDACRGAGTQPAPASSPGSASFSGPGNPKPHKQKKSHKKHHKHKKPQKKKKHGAKGHGGSSKRGQK
jgi:DNA-binding beta-propeller fold protein YncE